MDIDQPDAGFADGAGSGLLLVFMWILLAGTAGILVGLFSDAVLGPEAGGGWISLNLRNAIHGFSTALAVYFGGLATHLLRLTFAAPGPSTWKQGLWAGAIGANGALVLALGLGLGTW